jgi:hypothetical protein
MSKGKVVLVTRPRLEGGDLRVSGEPGNVEQQGADGGRRGQPGRQDGGQSFRRDRVQPEALDPVRVVGGDGLEQGVAAGGRAGRRAGRRGALASGQGGLSGPSRAPGRSECGRAALGEPAPRAKDLEGGGIQGVIQGTLDEGRFDG